MAQEKETKILLKVKADIQEFIDNIRTSKDLVTSLKEENKKLATEAKAALSKGLVEEYNKIQDSVIKNNASVKVLSQTIRDNEKVLVLQQQAQKASSGSYEQLLRNLRLAEIEFKNLEGTISKNEDGTFKLTDAYTAAQDQVLKAKDAIIQFDQGIKDGRTNVGNYEAAFKKTFDQISNVSVRIDGINGKLEELSTQYKENTISSEQYELTSQQLVEQLGLATDELQRLNVSAADIKRSTDEVAEGFKTLKQQLKDATIEAQQMQALFNKGLINEEALIASQKRVAALKEEIGDFEKRVDALNPEAKFKAFTQAAGSLAGGIQAATGLMAIFDDESDATTKLLVKLQAAANFANGLNQLAELGDAYKNIRAVLGLTTAATTVQTTAQAANTVVTEGQAVATGELAVAEGVAATGAQTLGASVTAMLGPIGIALLTIGAVVGALILLSSEAKGAAIDFEAINRESETFGNNLKVIKAASDAEVAAIESTINALKARGVTANEIATEELNLRNVKSASLIKERTETQQHLESLLFIQKSFSQQNIDALDEEERKKAIEQRKANEAEIATSKAQITTLLSQEKILREQFESEDVLRLRTAAEETNKIKISLLRDGQTKEIAEVRRALSEKLNTLRTDSTEENELRFALEKEAETKIRDIRQRFALEEVQQINQLSILSTVEGTEARVNASIQAEQRIRDIKLKDTALTEREQQIIIAESTVKIQALEDQRFEIYKNNAQAEIDLAFRKQQAILESTQVTTTGNTDKDFATRLANELEIITSTSIRENQIRESARQDELRSNEVFVNSQLEQIKFSSEFKAKTIQEQEAIIQSIITDGRNKEQLIDDTYDAEAVAAVVATGNKINEATRQSMQQRIQAKVEFAQLELDATGDPQEVLDKQLALLNAQEEQEIASKTRTEVEKLKIQDKYERLRFELVQRTNDANLQSTSQFLANSASLFRKTSRAYKALMIAQTIIDTYRGAQQAYNSLASIPYVGPALGVAAAAVAVAQGLNRVKEISSQNVETFEGGGSKGKGKSMSLANVLQRFNPVLDNNAEGFTNKPTLKVVSEHNQREWTAPEWMSRNKYTAPIINHLEEIRMTKVTPLADGGFVFPAPINAFDGGTQINNAFDMQAMKQVFKEAINEMKAPVVTVEDINAGQKRVATVENGADD